MQNILYQKFGRTFLKQFCNCTTHPHPHTPPIHPTHTATYPHPPTPTHITLTPTHPPTHTQTHTYRAVESDLACHTMARPLFGQFLLIAPVMALLMSVGFSILEVDELPNQLMHVTILGTYQSFERQRYEKVALASCGKSCDFPSCDTCATVMKTGKT